MTEADELQKAAYQFVKDFGCTPETPIDEAMLLAFVAGALYGTSQLAASIEANLAILRAQS